MIHVNSNNSLSEMNNSLGNNSNIKSILKGNIASTLSLKSTDSSEKLDLSKRVSFPETMEKIHEVENWKEYNESA